MPTSCEPRYIILRGGVTVPLEPLLLLLELEARGLSVTRDGDNLAIRPAGHLTSADRAALARHKHHVLALVTYNPDVA